MEISDLKFGENGLIPCITQDYRDNRVLMLAYMNRESFEKTITDKIACYYSRSRKKLWIKGEESGNMQKVIEIQIDCDKDTVLLKVDQIGDCACHKGYRSCFFRTLADDSWTIKEKRINDPGEMYKDNR